MFTQSARLEGHLKGSPEGKTCFTSLCVSTLRAAIRGTGRSNASDTPQFKNHLMNRGDQTLIRIWCSVRSGIGGCIAGPAATVRSHLAGHVDPGSPDLKSNHCLNASAVHVMMCVDLRMMEADARGRSRDSMAVTRCLTTQADRA